MQAEFKAIVLGNELNLNRVARHFGITGKLKWEDYLALQDNLLQGILKETENKRVYIFHFGSMVCINLQHHEIMDVIKYLKRLEPEINEANAFKYVDEYKLEIDADQPAAINNDFMVALKQCEYQQDIVATILAKSVSFEKNEIEVNSLLDGIENVVNDLHGGKLGVSDNELAKMSGRILSFKLNTISYIMLLDRPDMTWNNEEAAALYDELSELFELRDRYEKIRHKTETLMDITEVFSNLVHAKRGNRMEWAVIILIAIEIGISLYELFWR
ncbi:MAG: RMD1 family protein [Pelosinus sp.]|nr:RMD1 family protein [Pelosinus sp.]